MARFAVSGPNQAESELISDLRSGNTQSQKRRAFMDKLNGVALQTGVSAAGWLANAANSSDLQEQQTNELAKNDKWQKDKSASDARKSDAAARTALEDRATLDSSKKYASRDYTGAEGSPPDWLTDSMAEDAQGAASAAQANSKINDAARGASIAGVPTTWGASKAYDSVNAMSNDIQRVKGIIGGSEGSGMLGSNDGMSGLSEASKRGFY